MSRRRWVYTDGGKPCEPYEVDLSWRPAPSVELMTGTFYNDARATDGTPIDTRRRHADYLRATGSAMASDFKGVREKAQQEREAIRNGTHKTKEARQATEAAWTEVFERGGRR